LRRILPSKAFEIGLIKSQAKKGEA